MNPAQRPLRYIDSHLPEPLTLEDIAVIGGVSRYNMVRAFRAATGFSVMRYMRVRRLSEAARALSAGAPDSLNVALDADCGSHEAFTRIPRPFRGHARGGPRNDMARPVRTSGADPDGFHRTR